MKTNMDFIPWMQKNLWWGILDSSSDAVIVDGASSEVDCRELSSVKGWLISLARVQEVRELALGVHRSGELKDRGSLTTGMNLLGLIFNPSIPKTGRGWCLTQKLALIYRMWSPICFFFFIPTKVLWMDQNCGSSEALWDSHPSD